MRIGQESLSYAGFFLYTFYIYIYIYIELFSFTFFAFAFFALIGLNRLNKNMSSGAHGEPAAWIVKRDRVKEKLSFMNFF